MKVQLRADHVHLSGYVNAVERWSRPLTDGDGRRFVEKISAGTFSRALAAADEVGVMLNHDRALTSTKDGRVRLEEDNIGLRFEGDIFDPEVMERARKHELRGWSFGFRHPVDQVQDTTRSDADYERTISALELVEVSIIDVRKLPAYPATSVEVRTEDGGEAVFIRIAADEEIITEPNPAWSAEVFMQREWLRLKGRL